MKAYVALDNCLSHRLKGVLNALYGRHGFEFIHIAEDLGAGARGDTLWADDYRRFGGSIVLSGDPRIAYRPHEHVAFIDNLFVCYFPSKEWSDLRVHEHAAVIAHAWHDIMQHLAANPGPACWRFACVGKRDNVQLRPLRFTKLDVPQAVLDGARQARAESSRT